MARSDLLISLIKAGAEGNKERFRKTVDALVTEERAKQHNTLADRIVRAASSTQQQRPSLFSGKPHSDNSDLVYEVRPEKSLADMILPEQARAACSELIEEQHRCDLLRSHCMEPRHRILLAGPPGNGKTSLAEAIAEGLMLPLHVVRYEGLISSYLGETAQKIQMLFEFSKRRQCVLFFDEFDAIGKERGDVHETGEIKRVVNTLLMQIDQLPSHVVLIVATNHPELIDRAAWRRFQIRLSLPNPTQKALKDWIDRFQAKQAQSLGITAMSLAKKLAGASFAEVEDFALDIRRRQILEIPDADLKKIVSERLASWKSRFQVIGKGNGKAKKQSNSVSKAKRGKSKAGTGRRRK